MPGGAQVAPYCRMLVHSPAVALQPPWRHPRCRFSLRCALTSSGDLAAGGSTHYQPQPCLMTTQASPTFSFSVVRRDAGTGLAFLLFVLSVVMSSFLSLVIFSFPAHRALQQMETAADKLSKIVVEELPGTVSSLKLSLMEINDFSSQLKNLRQKLTINRFGKKTGAEERSQTGRQNHGDI